MIQYRKVQELYFNGSSQRNISTMVGSSRNTVKSIVERVKELGWTELKEEMTDYSLEEALFPEKTSVVKGYFNESWEYVHKELLKKNMTLILLDYCILNRPTVRENLFFCTSVQFYLAFSV